MSPTPSPPTNFSRLGYGSSGLMGVGSEEDRQRILQTAFDAGVTHFDTARYYGLGQAEAVIGRFAKSRPDKITITTKFGIVPEPLVEAAIQRASGKVLKRIPGIKGGFERFVASRAQTRRFRFGPSDVRASIDKSLATLGTDYVDLLLLHEARPQDVTPELLEILEECVKAGKARAYGVRTAFDALAGLAEKYPNLVWFAQFENSVLRPNAKRTPAAIRSLHTGR